MKNAKKFLATSFLAILMVAIATPLIAVMPASAEETVTPTSLTTNGSLTYIQNDFITIAFPANGTKPMFLWWYTKDPSNINVVKFKGLIEYSTYEVPYFLWRCQAEAGIIKGLIETHWYTPMMQKLEHLQKMMISQWLWEIGNYTSLHSPYLPFSSSKWRLDGPANVTKGEVKYLSFNFTLIGIPGHPNLQFAKDNIIIRCRFYYTPATEDVYGKYQYTVNRGELKIDLVINHWEWNIDKLKPIIEELRKLGIDIPEGKASLALWVNLASINMTKIRTAEDDAKGSEDIDLTENVSTAQEMYVEGSKVSVVQNNIGTDEIPLQNSLRERFKIRFETGNATFAGFFKFVPQAIVTDGVTYNTTDVTASYISVGKRMQLFIGYPYFGNNTLIHDPSLGVESVAPWLPTGLLMILIGATIAIAVAVAAVKLRKKTVNILNVQ
jgi:hypothetical protein